MTKILGHFSQQKRFSPTLRPLQRAGNSTSLGEGVETQLWGAFFFVHERVMLLKSSVTCMVILSFCVGMCLYIYTIYSM